MTSLPRVLESPDDHSHDLNVTGNRCPTCDQPIAQEQFQKIRERMAAQERKHAREIEARVSQERAMAEAKAATQIAAVEEAAAVRLATVKGEIAEQLLSAREDATKAANLATASKLIEAEQKRKSAEEQFEALKVSQETALNQRLAEQREALEQDKVKAVNLANAAAFKEKQKIEEQVAALTRQLQRKSADELGEGAEIDLFEALKAEFPQDAISRVKKGEPGADIVHKVMDKGSVCGCIVYDSKNRNAWRNDYVEKLRNDQIAAKADHAILTTHAFPAGAKQLHVQDGVIVANPARAVVIAIILRKQVLQLHSLDLSNDARDEKMAHLYDFITSDQFAQHLERIETLTQDMLDLDVKEKKAHDVTWNRRGILIRTVQRIEGDLSSEIDRIVGQTDTSVAAAG
jgi:hypothetical protein